MPRRSALLTLPDETGHSMDLVRSQTCLETGHPAGNADAHKLDDGIEVTKPRQSIFSNQGRADGSFSVCTMAGCAIRREKVGADVQVRWNSRRHGGRNSDQQDHGKTCENRHHCLEPVDDPLEHQNAGNPMVVKNHNELVSQIATSAVNTTPPATGRAQVGAS